MLDGKTVVVTGAAGTLGTAAAKAAKNYGAAVIGVDIVRPAAIDTFTEFCELDLLDKQAIEACYASLGGFDTLLNITGGFAMGEPASQTEGEHWDLMQRLNVGTLRNSIAASMPFLKANKRSSIVNVGALGALSGAAHMSAYICAKSNVMRLTESLSEELRSEGVNVNAVLPSIIDTAANRSAMPDADYSQWVSPADLAEVMCFLSSDRASAIHGALVPVRGLC